VPNQSSRKLRQKLSQWLHSLASRLEGEAHEPVNDSPASARKPKQKRRARRRNPLTLSQLSRQLKDSWLEIYRQRSPRFWLLVGLGVGVGTGAIALGGLAYVLNSGLPKSVDDVLTYAPQETLTIAAADGAVLQERGPVTHQTAKIWQIPIPVVHAFIASEDRRFQEHRGVDPQGILRAAFSNLQAGEVVEGGSTITQQLARIVFLNQQRTFGRKFKEMLLAQKIEQLLSKDQILERYLNLVYLGSGAYGVADAAWVYFSKPLDQLTLSEAATLAGIVPAPSLYSPLENPKVATERRNLVLQKMQEAGFITAQAAQAAIATPLTTHPSPPKRLQRQAPYFTDYVLKELPQYVSAEQLKAGGITVETTLNAQWQQAADAVIASAIERYGRWQHFGQAALVAIDPRSGQIKAMVGGNDFNQNQFNRVTQAKRQPGSTFKAFVYTAAIAAGVSPNRGYRDAEYIVDGYKPENFGDKYSGSVVSMRDALTRSLNVVAVQVLIDVGWNPIIQLAHKMGIESELKPTYSLALGSSEVNLLELTSAYGTFANQGIHAKPYAISRILDRQGKVLYQARPHSEEALDPQIASIMTWMLQGVVNNGTGIAAQIGRPVAGKTGTSDKARDLWFVGYIPQLVTGVWLGNDNNQPTWGGSSTAAATWRRFMLKAVDNTPIQTFPHLPQQLEGRKALLKAEPIKPSRSYYLTTTATENSPSTQVTDSSDAGTTRRRSRRRRRRHSDSQTLNQNSPSLPVKTNRASETQSVPIKVSAPPDPSEAPPAPASELVPPAPPAARKQ
jgi:penicillin-binding protein 1A